MSDVMLNTPEDMQWLFETHVPLRDLKISWEPRAAMVVGNEDCPTSIYLFPRRDPLITDEALVGWLDSRCNYVFCGPLKHSVAMKIDADERQREALDWLTFVRSVTD